MNFLCCRRSLVFASLFLMVFSMLWYSSLSVIFFKCVSVSLILSFVLTMVLSQCLSLVLEWRFLTLSTTCQRILGRNCQLWVPSLSFRPFGTSSSAMHRLKKFCWLLCWFLQLKRAYFSLSDIYITFFVFRQEHISEAIYG